MLHLGVAAWWGGELDRRAQAPALEPLRSVPPSAPRAVRWEPRPDARVRLAPSPSRGARAPEPAPEAAPPVTREPPTPREAAEVEAPPPAREALRWSELAGARAPRTAPVDEAAPADARAAPPPSAQLASAVAADLAAAEALVQASEAASLAEGATELGADAEHADVAAAEPASEPDTDTPGERAEPAPAPSDAASSSVAEALADNLPPAYPALALRRGWEGRVLLQVLVDADGAAREVSVLESSGVPLLDRTAREAVQGWRFEPARRDGRAEPGATTVALRFQLDTRRVGTEPNG